MLQLLQIALNLLHRRHCAFEVVRQCLYQGVFAHAHGLFHVAQGKFHLNVVFIAAQQQANGGLVVVAFEKTVHRRQIEVELARVFRNELTVFQLHHHVALERDVIEQQVNVVVVAGNFQVVLPAHEGKAFAQFQQKLGDVLGQLALYIQLVVRRCHRHEVEGVRVFQRLLGQVRLGHWQGA